MSARSAAADFGDEDDFAVGAQGHEIGVLGDHTVDRQRHAFVDLMALARGGVELENQPANGIRFSVTPALNRRAV